MPEFPAMLYKHGSEIEWDGERFDTLTVHNGDELDAALKDGWVPHKPSKKSEAKAASSSGEAPPKGSSKKAK
jgi:hypothetical protein